MAKRRRPAKAQRGRARALHLAGWLWLLGVALAFGYLWQTFGAGEGAAIGASWVRAAAFFMAAIGAGPILLYLTIERTGLLSSQTDNDGRRRVAETSARAVEMLGHGEASVRQGGVRTLQGQALDNPGEHAKIMDIMAGYLRGGSAIHVDDTIAVFQRARRGGGANEAAFLQAVRLVQRAVRALPEGSEKRLALGGMLERVQGWGEAAPSEKQDIGPDEITGLLLPALPMPIDLQAAVAAICAGLPRRDGEVQGEDGQLVLDLSGSHLYKADLRRTELRGADLSNVGLYECSLRGADLSSALLAGASIRNTNLDEAVLEAAEMPGADLRGSSLFLANLQRAHMHRANLEGTVLHSTDLRRARMARAALQAALFLDCQLQEAILLEADLRQVRFLGTQLQHANLKGGNLSHAHLEGSDVHEAILQGARLDGADLREAVNLRQEQVDQAMGDASTMLPNGIHPPSHWAGSARP